MLRFTAASLLALTFAVPAMAQNAAQNSTAATHAPATHDTAGSPTGNGYNTPSQRNSVMTDSAGLRMSKVVGSSVYNDRDEKVGSVDDVVMSPDHSLNAVVSVGGFLGVGSKMVEVPFNKLQFGNTKASSDNRVVMPGVNKDALTSMPDYHYQAPG